MQIGEPTRTVVVEPAFLPEPLREPATTEQPEQVPAEPEKEPVEQP